MSVKVLDRQFKQVAFLENAFGIGYEKRINELWSAHFSLPLNDQKNEYCQPFNYAEIIDDRTGEYIGLFRIEPSLVTKDESQQKVEYHMFHVAITLLDGVLFDYHQTDNRTTRYNIEYILSHQIVPHFVLGDCAFTRYFSYKFEDENGLLGPLFSIPEPFDEDYIWEYDTTVYPWKLHLRKPSNEVECEIRYGNNMVGIEREYDPETIVNRIYAKGYGEGVNALRIDSVNNGIPYVEDAASIQKYGLRPYIWTDKRFEKAESLKANAQALLKKWKDPIPMYRIAAADISSLTNEDIHRLKNGRIVRVVDDELGTFEQRIVSEKKSDMVAKPGDIQLQVGNLTEDIATLHSDLTRRQQINETYSQGATNLSNHDFEDNADANHPAVLRFYLPDEMVRINKLYLTFETDYFRAYSKSAKAGGGVVKSTSSGGGQTTSSGGGQTTSSGGGTSTTSGQANGYAVTLIPYLTDEAIPSGSSHVHGVVVDAADLDHWHTVNISPHTHTVANHTHTVSAHTHDINLEPHTHPLEYGIYKHNELPTQVSIKVDGQTVPYTSLSAENLDLIPYLAKDSQGNVVRGPHRIEISPNDLARISAQVMVQFFIQSRGGTRA
ncbi:hypothetical protein C4578_04120 [Candidatus Microgenomates bacterium]|nr:MAG: hypothetical protein C4578_04120 [Candidatus Microgenomates bacterium]